MGNLKQLTIRQQLSRITPLSFTAIVLFAAAMTYFLLHSFAASGTATLYTSPAGTQTVTNGQTFTVNVRISSGAAVPVTGGSVYLSYPASKLQVLGESYTGSPYTTQLVATDSGGVLRMDRAAFPAIAGGDQIFAQVTFKAIATGSAPINFTGSSIVTSGEDDSNILTQKNGVTYTVEAPASTTPPTPPTPSTPATGSGSSSGGSTTGPTTSSGSSKSTTSPKTGSNSSGSNSTASGGSQSTPSTTASGTGANPAQTTGDTSEGSTPSTIQITILDGQHKPVEGAQVTVDGQTVKTDKNGVARFTSVAAGNQTLAVTYNGKKTAKIVQVKNAASQSSPQLFNVSITKDKLNPTLLVLPVIILFGAGAFFLRPSGAKFAKSPVAAETPVTSSSHPPETAPKPGYRSLDTPGTVYAPQTPASTTPPHDTSETKK